jgi:hypothetical protein
MMPTQSRILAWVPAILFIASLAFGAWVLSLPPRVDCVFDIMGKFPSPNGRQVALVVREGCGGATNAFVTSVAIKGPGEDFRFEDDRLFSVHSQIAMEIVWSDNNSLTIVYERPYRIYRQLVVWGMMPISYREKQ